MSRILNIGTPKTMINCFICDQRIAGEKVNLTNSLSTHSKVTLPEKISQLIGDDFVVAVTEQDCVCKRCASLLNHMDKLENELTLVKRALTSNISHKYKITLTDAQITPQTIANGLRTDSASDYEDEGRKVSALSDSLNTSALAKKKPVPINKVVAPPKPIKPAENVTKLKIYKCGFCSYQSKELGNVRMHMKIHIKNKSESEPEKGVAAASPLLTPKASVPVRRRVFRCQVCSASFDDRNKCLEHISRDHTTAGRKLAEQKQSPADQSPIASKPTSSAPETESVPGTPAGAAAPEQSETEHLETQKESEDQEPMETDSDFTDLVKEHAKSDSAAVSKTSNLEEGDTAAKSDTEFSSQEGQEGNDDENPKESNIGLDIEAMIAALHSEGPESGSGDSMPNI